MQNAATRCHILRLKCTKFDSLLSYLFTYLQTCLFVCCVCLLTILSVCLWGGVWHYYLRCSSRWSSIVTLAYRYLGVFIVRSRNFKCSLDTAKRSFYRAANAIFGKVGRIASEDVTLQLLSSKCIPLLLYGLESIPLSSSQLASLDFTINRFLGSYSEPITSTLSRHASLNLVLNFLLLCWHVETKFCVKLISVIIICYVCSVRLLRLVTPLCVCIVCSCLHFLIKSALLLACIFYHSWWIKDKYRPIGWFPSHDKKKTQE